MTIFRALKLENVAVNPRQLKLVQPTENVSSMPVQFDTCAPWSPHPPILTSFVRDWL